MINCVLKVNDLAFVLSCWDYVIPLSRITFIAFIIFIHGEHWTVYPISTLVRRENIKIEPNIFQNKVASYDVTLSRGLSCALPELQQPQLFSWTVISGKTKPKINSPHCIFIFVKVTCSSICCSAVVLLLSSILASSSILVRVLLTALTSWHCLVT